jgi:hypothetical protein
VRIGLLKARSMSFDLFVLSKGAKV